jgi:integrase
VRSLTDDDLHAWAEHRRDEERVSPRAINKNDLVAASSMFKWAMDRNGGRVIAANPVAGVHLDEPRALVKRERTFRPVEVRAILKAALDVTPHSKDVSISNAARWCPWLAAYSGARIAELCHLRGRDIWIEDGVPVMHLWKAKGGIPRKVPIHAHLVEQGFLEFVRSYGGKPLFYDEARHRKGAQTDPAEIRAQQLAIWVRDAAGLKDRDVDPQHGWRHSFKTIALGAGIEERIRDAITGHKVASVGRKYEAPPVSMLAEALAKFPQYQVR